MHAVRPPLVTDDLHAALDDLLRVDPRTLTDRQVNEGVRSLQEAEARVAAAKARMVAAMDARKTFRHDGAQTAAQWIAHTCGIPKGIAARDVSTARSLRRLPDLAQSLADGDTGIEKVRTICRLHRSTRTRADVERDDPTFATAARNLGWPDFQQVVAYWLLHNDPDGSDDDAEQRRERRRFSLTQLPDGSWHVSGRLDPVTSASVDTALRRIDDELRDEDKRDATDRLGRPPMADELARTPQQRRADALAEMARRACSTPAGSRRPAPLVNVVVDIATFGTVVSELFDGTVVHHSDVVDLVDDAFIERVVFDGPDRVMHVGRQRHFRDAVRRAIEVRDRRCTHPLCDMPAERCDGDHVERYEDGGITAEWNGRLHCPFHNHLRETRPPPDDDEP